MIDLAKEILDDINNKNGAVAQEVEQQTENLRVGGSTPPSPTIEVASPGSLWEWINPLMSKLI